MARSVPRCREKHGREMKMKDLNPTKESEFPCKLRLLEPTEQENSGNCVIIGLAFLELEKVLLRHVL